MLQSEDNLGVQKMGRKSKSHVLPPQTIAEPSAEQVTLKRQATMAARRTMATILPDRLANSSFWVRNQPIPKSKELFPLEWNMQF